MSQSNDDQRNLTIAPDDDPYAGGRSLFPELDHLNEDEEEKTSSTDSLSSSVFHYQFENGRRYHAYREGAYAYPNDEREQERLDLQHHVCLLVLDGELFRAPVDLNGARVLDLGTGTGLWAVEVGDEYSTAEITGTDLSPIQPDWVPPNCHFEITDFESEWEFRKPFDYIHGRNIGGSVHDLPLLLNRIKNNLNNNGWVEFVDFYAEAFSDDNSLERAPYVVEWCQLVDKASVQFGKQVNIAPCLKQSMIDAGFKNVTEEIYKVPANPWAKDPKLKEIGRYQQLNLSETLETFSMALFTRVLGWTTEQIHAFLTEVRKELKDRTIHIYSKYAYIYGQKVES